MDMCHISHQRHGEVQQIRMQMQLMGISGMAQGIITAGHRAMRILTILAVISFIGHLLGCLSPDHAGFLMKSCKLCKVAHMARNNGCSCYCHKNALLSLYEGIKKAMVPPIAHI